MNHSITLKSFGVKLKVYRLSLKKAFVRSPLELLKLSSPVPGVGCLEPATGGYLTPQVNPAWGQQRSSPAWQNWGELTTEGWEVRNLKSSNFKVLTWIYSWRRCRRQLDCCSSVSRRRQTVLRVTVKLRVLWKGKLTHRLNSNILRSKIEMSILRKPLADCDSQFGLCHHRLESQGFLGFLDCCWCCKSLSTRKSRLQEHFVLMNFQLKRQSLRNILLCPSSWSASSLFELKASNKRAKAEQSIFITSNSKCKENSTLTSLFLLKTFFSWTQRIVADWLFAGIFVIREGQSKRPKSNWAKPKLLSKILIETSFVIHIEELNSHLKL